MCTDENHKKAQVTTNKQTPPGRCDLGFWF